MELKNYWWLIGWLFIGGLLLNYAFPKRKEMQFGKYVYRWQPIAALLFVLPYISWAGFRTYFVDTVTYIENFKENVPDSIGQFATYYASLKKDKAFYMLEAVIKTFISHKVAVLFLILAAIQMLSILSIYRKYSEDFWFSIFVFIATTDYMSWMHNGIRQFMAVTIIFAATDFIINKKYISIIIVILLASTFHQSALIMIPIVFVINGKAWNRKTILAIILCIVALIFVDRFTDILDSALENTQYTNVVSDWQAWEDNGTNPLRVLVYAIPMLLSVFGIKYMRVEKNPIINLSTNASIITTGIGLVSMVTSGIFIGRLPIYVSLYANGILLPWEINHMFDTRSARMIKVTACIFYLAFFYYQMHITWHLI